MKNAMPENGNVYHILFIPNKEEAPVHRTDASSLLW